MLIILIVVFSFLILIILIFKINETPEVKKEIEGILTDSSYDVSKPKFTINSEEQKISVSANKGNFKNNDEILLQNNVLLQSNKFKIYSDYVIFNKKNQTANSQNESVFIAKGTRIESEGFNIIEKGNIIKFIGNTKLTISE